MAQEASSAQKSTRVVVTGSGIRREPADAQISMPAAAERAVPADAAAAMLERIEALLAAGNQQAAIAAWKELQRLHPAYPIPDATREKLNKPLP